MLVVVPDASFLSEESATTASAARPTASLPILACRIESRTFAQWQGGVAPVCVDACSTPVLDFCMMHDHLAVQAAKRMEWSISGTASAGVAQPDRISGCRLMLGQLAVPSAKRMGW